MFFRFFKLFLSLLCCFYPFLSSWAEPPYVTNDPVPQTYQTFNTYLFALLNETNLGSQFTAPAVEIDYGLIPNVEINTIVPLRTRSTEGSDQQAAAGFGDVQFGLKFRFIQETETSPQVSFTPIYFIPTGNADKTLGNGKPWIQIPLSIQKSWDAWTAFGTLGYALNDAPQMKNFIFGGAVLERNVTEKLTLGAEVISQGAMSSDQGFMTIINLGGYYFFTPHFSIPISVGHSVLGENALIGYAGLNWVFA